jgi:hypothetical protein
MRQVSAHRPGFRDDAGWIRDQPEFLYLFHSALTQSPVRLVGAVGIELKATLKARKLLILCNAKNVKNS